MMMRRKKSSNEDDENKEEKPEKAEVIRRRDWKQKKAAICAKTPLATLVEPFKSWKNLLKNKAMRAKCEGKRLPKMKRLKEMGEFWKTRQRNLKMSGPAFKDGCALYHRINR